MGAVKARIKNTNNKKGRGRKDQEKTLKNGSRNDRARDKRGCKRKRENPLVAHLRVW